MPLPFFRQQIFFPQPKGRTRLQIPTFAGMEDNPWLSRTRLLIGNDNTRTLQNAHVFIAGLGGVGSYAAEAICRAGVGTMTLMDGDVVDPSNRNRQLPALLSTQAQFKTRVMKQRLLDINPDLVVHALPEFLTPESAETMVVDGKFDYIVDAIDGITPKCSLIAAAHKHGVPVISSMGAGGKLDPTRIKIADIADTYNCYLASVLRKRLRKMGIKNGVRAVFSDEKVLDDSLMVTDGTNFKKSAYGTISYLPAAFGLFISSVVVCDLIGWKTKALFPGKPSGFYSSGEDIHRA